MNFDLRDILVTRNVEFNQTGNELNMDCPICGRENHFYFNIKSNLCICQRCKWEGNHLTFLIMALGFTKKNALSTIYGSRRKSLSEMQVRTKRMIEELDDEEEISDGRVFFRNPIPGNLTKVLPTRFPKVFKERGIPVKLAMSVRPEFCNIKGKYFNRIIFPVNTLKNSTFVGVTALTRDRFKKVKESYERVGENFRKVLFPYGSLMSEVLYLYNNVRTSEGSIFVVEGVWDTLKVLKYGSNAVATFGDKVSRSQAVLLSETNANSIYLMLDGDVPSDRLLRYYHLLDKVCFDKEIYLCSIPKEKDPDDLSLKEFARAIDKSHSKKNLARLKKDGHKTRF